MSTPSPTPPGTTASDGRGFLLAIGAVAALGGFLFGYDTGVISGAQLFLKDDLGPSTLSSFEQGAVVSGLLLGAAVGAISGGRLANRYGRRPTLIATAVLFIAGILVVVASQAVVPLVAGRFVIGLGVGAASMTVPLYLSEIAPPASRGRIVSLNQLMIVTGIVTAYLVDYALASSGEWRWMFAVGILPALGLGIGMLFLPETPRWLVARGRVDEARAILRRTHDEDSLQAEIDSVERGRPLHQDWAALRDPALRLGLVVGVGLALIQQVTGINTIIYYAPTILQSTGLSSSSSILNSVAIGAVNLVATVGALFLIDRVGRRTLLVWSLSGMVASLGLIGLAFQVTSGDTQSWLALVCLVAYVAAFAIGLGPVFWLLISEIYPLRARGAAMSLAAAANWIGNFAVGLTYLLLVEALGRSGAFWLYGVLGLASIGFVLRYVPETRGRSLEAIEADLDGQRPAPGTAPLVPRGV
jgi:sugar porter (SP) family MFS transporter